MKQYYNKFISPPKSRGKPSKTPEGMCRHCNKKINKENEVFYSGHGIKRECKPCIRKINNEKNRIKRLKETPLW